MIGALYFPILFRLIGLLPVGSCIISNSLFEQRSPTCLPPMRLA